MRARKKPVEVDFRLFTGYNFWSDIAKFCPDAIINDGDVFIRTLEGLMRVSPGDYVIKGVAGEFYPCKPDIFHSTYDVVG